MRTVGYRGAGCEMQYAQYGCGCERARTRPSSLCKAVAGQRRTERNTGLGAACLGHVTSGVDRGR